MKSFEVSEKVEMTEKTLLRPPGKTEDNEEAKEFEFEEPNCHADWPAELPRTALEFSKPKVFSKFAPDVIFPFLKKHFQRQKTLENELESYLRYVENELTDA